MSKIIPVTQFRRHILEAIRKAKKSSEEYVITSNGEPAAVLVGFDEWESLLETLAIKRDKTLMAAIKKGRSYFKRKGKGKTHTKLEWDS